MRSIYCVAEEPRIADEDSECNGNVCHTHGLHIGKSYRFVLLTLDSSGIIIPASRGKEPDMADVVVEEYEVLFVVEGERKPRGLRAHARVTVAEFLQMVMVQTGRGDLVEVLIEDQEIVLEGHHVLADLITVEDFKLWHVATPGLINVVVAFNGRPKDRTFRSNATMKAIVKWAMEAFELAGDPSDFQLKYGDD